MDTPNAAAQAFTVATNAFICSLVSRARARLVVVAPAVSTQLAEEICKRWQVLPPGAVTVVLDSEPDVYRLGYGDLAGLERLHRVAAELGVTIGRQPGLRIGLVIADGQTLIYTPTAEMIETGPGGHGAANAICLQSTPRTVEMDLGLSLFPATVGREPMSESHKESIKKDLAENPPQKFNIARKVNVFNAFIEFVDLEVEGTKLSKKTVTIPSHLLAVADAKTREQLRTTFRLVPPKGELSGAEIDRDRHLLTRRFLKVIPGHGVVIQRRDKDSFEKGVKNLQAAVQKFARRVEAKIQVRIDKNIAELSKSLLPSLSRRPPKEWIPSSGQRPPKEDVRRFLEEDLKGAFGTAAQLVGEMKVRCVFKGVTYELLKNSEFLQAATKAIPDLKRFHKEFEAAEGVTPDSPQARSKSGPGGSNE